MVNTRVAVPLTGTHISLVVWTVVDLQVDQGNDSSWLLVTRGLEVIQTVVCEDEPASAPALVLPT